MKPNTQTNPEPEEDDIRPSNLPMQTVRPDVYVPIKKDPSAKKQRAWSITSKLAILFGVIFMVIGVNLWVMQPFFVDGESMSPTLHTKDTLLVHKWPQTWAGLTNSRYIPDRYDVVIVQNPQDPQEKFVKRVLGLPGERIVVNDGKITVYNEQNPRGEDVTDPPCCDDLEKTSGDVDTEVREGHIFVVGDNRPAGGSIDSRASLGQIPSRYIIGRAIARITPASDMKTL